jgi:UDP-N-acetylmuramoyl-L-alanyl-D-glutamate--2,6-diaminopimelate ligase
MKLKVKKIVSDLKKSPGAKVLRYARGLTASVIHEFPANKMTVIGVTGTDGKTTTCNLVYHFLKSAGFKVGLVSTISARIFNGEHEVEYDTGFHVTSPDSFSIQKYLKQMVEAGCTHAVVECTSHALEQERYAGINFDIGVVTNITHEHLDYHKTFDRYILAKSQLFRHDTTVPRKDVRMDVAVVNQDDKAWELLKPYLSNWHVVGYGFSDFSNFHVVTVKYTTTGTDFVFQVENEEGEPVQQYNVHSPLMGKYNVSNVMAALSAVSFLNIPLSDLIMYVASFPQLPGRFERFETMSHGLVVVDFAHTPNAMHEVLTVAKEITKGKVIVVFGCAGLRDVDKRYIMGTVSGKLAHVIILTAEDPRTESVKTINDSIAKGLQEQGAEEYPHSSLKSLAKNTVKQSLSEHYPIYIRIDDRKEAIQTALSLANSEDIVMILGKGHEKSMAFGSEELPWSDQDAVREAINSLENS